jgi:hypothetical protein
VWYIGLAVVVAPLAPRFWLVGRFVDVTTNKKRGTVVTVKGIANATLGVPPIIGV